MKPRRRSPAQAELQLIEGGPVPVPPDLDLRHFPKFPIDVHRLKGSKILATSTGDAFRAALMAWMAAWHEVPCGSLPDDDAHLASLCGFGRDPDGWEAIRATALHGFVRLEDGRLYHPVVCEMALAAMPYSEKQRATSMRRWGSKLKLVKPNSENPSGLDQKKDSISVLRNTDMARGAEAEGIREPEGRSQPVPAGTEKSKSGPDPEKAPKLAQGALWAEPAPEGAPKGPEAQGAPAGGDGTPDAPETILAQIRPVGPDATAKALWGPGRAWLARTAQIPDAKARQLIGQWVKLAGRANGGQNCALVLGILGRAQGEGVGDPVPWVFAALGGKLPDSAKSRRIAPKAADPGGVAAQVLAQAKPDSYLAAVNRWEAGGCVGPAPRPDA